MKINPGLTGKSFCKCHALNCLSRLSHFLHSNRSNSMFHEPFSPVCFKRYDNIKGSAQCFLVNDKNKSSNVNTLEKPSARMTETMKKMTFLPCWSLYSWYKVLPHKQYFPSAPFPLLPPSLCPCEGWSQRRWPAWRALEKHIRVIPRVKCRGVGRKSPLSDLQHTCLGKHSQWSSSRLR